MRALGGQFASLRVIVGFAPTAPRETAACVSALKIPI